MGVSANEEKMDGNNGQQQPQQQQQQQVTMKRTTRMIYVEEKSIETSEEMKNSSTTHAQQEVSEVRQEVVTTTTGDNVPDIIMQTQDSQITDADVSDTDAEVPPNEEGSGVDSDAEKNILKEMGEKLGVNGKMSPKSPRSPKSPKSPRSPRPLNFAELAGGMKSPKPLVKSPLKDMSAVVPAMRSTHKAFRSNKISGLSGIDGPMKGMKGKKSLRAMNLDELKGIEDSLLYETMKILVVAMKLSGIFFVKKKGSFGKSPKERLKSLTVLQIYCLLTMLVLSLNFIRTFFAFEAGETFGSMLFFKLLTSIFAYEAMSRAFLAYWGCYKKKHGFPNIFLSLEKICFSDGIIPYESSLKTTMHSFLGLTILISGFNSALTAYFLYGPDAKKYEAYTVPVPDTVPGFAAFKAFMLMVVFINSNVAMLSLTFYTVICYNLHKEFEYLCRTFKMKIRDDGSFTDEIEKFRIMHQKRCKLVEDVDQNFKYYIANTYMTNVPLLCLLLYIIVYPDDDDIVFRMINSFRLVYVFIQMMVVSVAATQINDQGHAPLADIYSIRVERATSERQLELNMFLNKLTGTQIGLTAWDMFVINKPAILTVIGMILTYFFLLMQFKNPLQGEVYCNCVWNGTNISEGIVTEQRLTNITL